jgi:hypothetical protein
MKCQFAQTDSLMSRAKMKTQILSILVLALSANGLVFRRQGEGPCPEITTVDSLNLEDVSIPKDLSL